MDFKSKTQTVHFEDSEGVVIGTLTIRRYTLADDQTRVEMEEVAQELNAAEVKAGTSNEKRQSFRLNVYPKLFACSTGDVPDEETAYSMPAEELYKWYDAAHEVNPEWFRVFDEIREAYQRSKAEGQAAEKKSEAKQQES